MIRVEKCQRLDVLGDRMGGLINLVLAVGIIAMHLGGPTGGGYPCLDRNGTSEARQIFEGITYGCTKLEPDEEGSGFLYWVRVDLVTPGIELYVTPKDEIALRHGCQYRLRRIGGVVKKENLAIAINGSLFSSKPGWWPLM